MQKKIAVFDALFQAVCETGERIRKGQFADSGLSVERLKENGKSLADYCEGATERDAVAYRNAQFKTEDGTWFMSRFFRRILVHMQLLEALRGADYAVETDILGTLTAYLGPVMYFDVNKREAVMEYAGALYLAAKREKKIWKSRIDESVQLLIDAVRILEREGIHFRIVQGEPEFEEDSEKVLNTELDRMTEQAGGQYVIGRLFEQELNRRYHADLGRYLIHRGKRMAWGGEKPESRIPYQYLLQLSMKHLKENGIYSGQRRERLYEKLIRLSQAYSEVLQLQGYYALEDTFVSLTDFSYMLSRNLCFEKMHIPRQYHPQYVEMLLKQMLQPFYPQGVEKLRPYSFFNYVKMAEYILEYARGPGIFRREELKEALGLSDYKLDKMLQDISMDAEQVNPGFLHYLDETNTWRKPLIRLDEERYFCLDGRMSGYAFYEVMYQILFAIQGSGLSRLQGPRLEQMVRRMFQDKHFSYVAGKYKQIGDLPERDCDMILEGRKQIMFLEIKKCPLPGTYEQGDDVKVLQSIGDGMLYAQEQILWHKLRLKEKGVLELYDENGNRLPDFAPGKKPVIAVSICMPEYDFLTDRNITETFLESTLLVTYHARDPKREALLDRLNKRIRKIQMISVRLFDGKPFEVRDVFFDSQFRSLQQIWTMLRFCSTVEEFLDMCEEQLLIITGEGDVYMGILNTLRMRNAKKKDKQTAHFGIDK